MQALSQTNAGDTCTIKWMFGVPEILETMRKMDIKEGSTIQVIQKCRDWLIIGSNNRRLAVGNEGSGLGLSIAKDLVQLQGGEFKLYLDGDLFKVTIEFKMK